ncbi:MAG: formate dehydrogenase [Kordiimonadaceae bacterium]|nr:formate dehydrogenase [Kordiimonadaceae bacterium]
MSSVPTLYIPLDSVAVSLGADQLADKISSHINSKNLPINIVRTGSRGMHWLEPLVEIDLEGQRIGFGPLDEQDIEPFMHALAADATQHPKYLGPIADIPFFKDQTRLIFSRCGEIDPLQYDAYVQLDGGTGLRKALAMKPADICSEVLASGLRGRGGAGFPAGIKWQTVAGAEADQKYIVVNADEGDSGTFADRMIMEGDPLLLIEGMAIAGVAVGATQGYIYLRSEYPIAERILKAALDVARKNNMLGGNILDSGKAFDVEVFVGAGAYICGEETSLLNSLEGKRGEVRIKPPLPALEGLFGKPTLIHNVISLCSVPTILSRGADFYRDFGMGRSTGTMPFQIAGNVKHAGLFETAFGVTLRDLVEKYGVGTLSGAPIRAVQIGGPLGAYLPEALFDLPMDYETMAQNGAGVGHGGIVVFDEQVDLQEQVKYAFEFCVEESCGKCTPCRVGAVRGVEIMEKIKNDTDTVKQMELLDDLCELMVEGSLCAMGGMTPIPIQSAMKHFPEDFKISGGQTTLAKGGH